MRFNNFEIRKPVFIGKEPDDAYYKYHFVVVKHNDNGSCFVIAHLDYNHAECAFEFSSVGTRYLQYREDGLEEWLLKWCELKQIEFNYENNPEKYYKEE